MTRKSLILIAAGGSAAALAFALFSQYALGLWPCVLCIWQRWPHVVAVIAGGGALATSGPLFPLLGAASALTTAGIGGFHTGVEQGWWEGLQSCTAGPGIGGLSMDQLLNPATTVPQAARCDEVTAAFAGISMASWNMAFSLVLAGIWIAAALRSKR